MDITSYLLGKKAGGGSQPPNLEEKSVTITTNKTTTISPGEGYDGLKSVEVTTNVAGDFNAKITNNYEQLINLSSSITSVDMAGITIENLNNAFKNFKALTAITNFNTSTANNLASCFQGCVSLVTVPGIDTSNVRTFNSCFSGCSVLVNVPILNFGNVNNSDSSFQNMFSYCDSLSNDSLNNIMASCLTINPSYTTTKTLHALGLSQTQATTCTTLSNYAAFTAAGWTTGY